MLLVLELAQVLDWYGNGALGTIKYSWKNASSVEVGDNCFEGELVCWNLYTNGF
jgi:hypothetical protein